MKPYNRFMVKKIGKKRGPYKRKLAAKPVSKA